MGSHNDSARTARGGWAEAFLFVLTIALLNLSYVGAHAVGAQPIAFLVCAMLITAATLLACSGMGADAVRVMRAPLSWLVGSCIIGMEAFYYLLLWYVTPAEASVLTRLSIPVAMAMGLVLYGRRPARAAIAGALVVCGGVFGLALQLEPASAVRGLALACACALVMNSRSFAAETHPWNRRAKTVVEKMRVTGLVVLVTSCSGAALVALLMALATTGALGAAPWLPRVEDFLHVPTLLVAALVGVLVLTAMQYLAFSSVVKIGTENFVAVTAFTPVATLIAQQLAASAGALDPIPFDWRLLPPMIAVIAGVFVILWAARSGTLRPHQRPAE